MTTITVSTAAELEDALRKATGGETILLESGDYGLLKIGEWTSVPAQYASAVRIASADAENPASFSEMDLRDVGNLAFENIAFDYDFAEGDSHAARPFKVSSSTGVTFNSCTFDGDRAAHEDFSIAGTGITLTVRDSQDVRIEDSTFDTFYKGVAISESKDVVLAGNDIFGMRSDGVNVTSTSGLLVEGNHFHDFHEAVGSPDHRDFLQFWTRGSEAPTTDVVIRGNLFDVGEGSWTQSIFMRNERVDKGEAGSEMFYRNILIEENVILNDHPHGITVGEVSGLVIQNNTLLAKEGGGTFGAPSINVADASTDVSILRNVTESIRAEGTKWDVRENVLVQDEDDSGADHYSSLFYFSTLYDGGIPLLRPGSLADAAGAGAGATFIDGRADGSLLLSEEGSVRIGFDVFDVAGEPTTKVFDAAAVMAAQGYGTAEIGAMRFSWSFADGTAAEGPVVSRDFEGSGMHGVSLKVTLAGGQVVEAGADVVILSPTLLRLGDGGLTVSDLGEEELAFASGGQIALERSGMAAEVKDPVLSRMGGSEGFSLDLEIRADKPGSSDGEIMQFIGMLRVMTKGPDVIVSAHTDLGEHIKLVADGTNVNDGAPHRIAVDYDASTRTISLAIDGETTAVAAMSGDLVDTHSRLVIGDPWGKANFEGVISEFRVEVTDPVEAYEGTWTPVEASSDAPAPIGTGPIEIVEIDQPVLLEEQAFDPVGTSGALASDAGAAQFDLAVVRSGGDIQLDDGVTFENTSGGPSLRFDGDGGHARLVGLDDPENDGAFTVGMSYVNDDPAAAARLLWNHQTFGIQVQAETVKVFTKVEGSDRMKVFSAKAEALDDGGERKIAVAIDSELDRIQILVDGEVVLDEAGKFDIDLADEEGAYDWGWWVGTPWNRHFDGEVTGLTFHDEAVFEPSETHQDDAAFLS